MRVDELKQKLQAASESTFTLAAGDLGVAGVADLLSARLGGALTISGARPNPDELSVEGTASVDTMQNRPVKVWFSTEKDAVTGLLIACQSSDWSIATSFLKFAGDYLAPPHYSFTSLALVLSARPEDDTATTYGVGVGVYISAAAKSLFLHACLPPKEQNDSQTADIRLYGEFSGISLGNLGLLASFVSDYDFTKVLPDTIPLADQFALRSATFVVNPNFKFVVAVGLEVRSAHPWVLVENKFQFDYLDISFMINAPGAGSKTIYWNLTSEMKIGDSVEVIAGIDSDLNLLAELGEPVPIKPLLNQYFPAADLDLTVDTLSLYLAFGQQPPGWGLELAVATGWTLFDAIALRSIELFVSGQGASPESVKIHASLKLGDAKLYLGGEMNTGAGWDFAGRLAHDYSVQIVPNEAFDPSQPGSQPLKLVPRADGKVSNFFGNIFDKLFPGSGGSGVPPLIDLNVKTLGVAFNTQTKDFHFDTEIDFGDDDVETVLTFSSLHQQGAAGTTFEKRATGVIKVFPGQDDEFAFDLGIDLKQSSKHFIALYSNTSAKPIPLGKLVKAMFPDSPVAPPDFGITIKDAIVGYASDGTTSQSVFAIDMDASIDLSSLGDIPLVGQSLSAAKTLKLAFQLVYPAIAQGAAFAKTDLAALNGLISVAGPKLPAEADLTALAVKTELRLGDGDPIDLALPVKVNATSGQLEKDSSKPAFNPPGSQPTNDDVKWFQLNKQFGPVHLQRAGFKFDASQGEITALLDGGLAALGLEVDLMGLSMGMKITDVKNGTFAPTFGLQGLGISFSKGGVEIAGALLHLQNEYDGFASVQAETFRLAAIGSLATVEGAPSLFLYAALDSPLGGPPFFYITGLAGGFGLNRHLVPPPIDQVSAFPLIVAAMDPPKMPTDAGSAGAFITAQMQQIQKSLVPSVGEYFGCAGIRFTTFKLLDSFALVSLSFGHEFELDLFGLSTLVVPPMQSSTPALAVVSLQIAASFIPDAGIVIVQGQLTKDSYLLDLNCHLTGGFAFAAWFGSNAHAGDFVITLGGYHPDFQQPGYYPTVPRVGVNWQISSELSVVGGLYFALTPRALMAGGSMHATLQVGLDLGIASVEVKAWFMLGADFIVYWKPFHYGAGLYIDIGLDIVIHFLGTHELGLDVGAQLDIWGSPFGGYAHVELKIIGLKIGFNVKFGASAPAPAPLFWDDGDAEKSFRKSFLPADNQITAVAIAGGLIRKVDLSNEAQAPGASAAVLGAADQVWYIVNPSEFSVKTSSVVPIKQCETTLGWADTKSSLADFGSNTEFGIASMGKNKAQVDTVHQITIMGIHGDMGTHFALRPITYHVPGGLWAEQNSDDINAQRLIENVATGFEILPAREPVAGHTQPIDRNLLKYETYCMDNAYADDPIGSFTRSAADPGDDPAANAKVWERIQAEIHTNTTRAAMLAAMGFAAADIDIGESFITDAVYAPSYGVLSI